MSNYYLILNCSMHFKVQRGNEKNNMSTSVGKLLYEASFTL